MVPEFDIYHLQWDWLGICPPRQVCRDGAADWETGAAPPLKTKGVAMPSAHTSINEVVDGIYRISTFGPGYGITFNQFLIEDERPALVHTGVYHDVDRVNKAIREVLDSTSLAYVLLLHFEADECGGMQSFVDQAPDSTLVGSDMSAQLNLSAWDYRGPYKGMKDGETLELGRHTHARWNTHQRDCSSLLHGSRHAGLRICRHAPGTSN